MNLQIESESKTCLECKPHRHELGLTEKALEASKGHTMLLDGGSGKKVLVPGSLSQYLRKSVDIDLLMPHSDALKSFSNIKADKMVDRIKHISQEGKLGYEFVALYSPFPVYRDSGYPDTDIFTNAVGVGPIILSDEVFKNPITVKLNDTNLSINVADISFTIATSINPLVFTDQRALSSFIALLSNSDIFDIEDVASKTAAHLRLSIEKVNGVVEKYACGKAVSHVASDKNYVKYAQILSQKIPNKLMAIKYKLEKIMSHASVEKNTVASCIKSFNRELESIGKILRD